MGVYSYRVSIVRYVYLSELFKIVLLSAPIQFASGDSPLVGSDDFQLTRTPIEHGGTHLHLKSKVWVSGAYDIRGKL